MPTSKSLLSIATCSDLRVQERIKIIKGEDKKISSAEEANAILSIPSSDVVWMDNKYLLPLAQMEARNYLQHGDKNLVDNIKTAYNYCKSKGDVIFSRISYYFSSQQGSVAQNDK